MTHDDLIILKLHVMNFDMNTLNLIRKENKVKINSSFRSYMDLLLGVLQRSILRLSLFNLFLCGLFLFVEEADITSYADDYYQHLRFKNIDVTVEKLEEMGKIRFEWFSKNFLETYVYKCHLI